MSTLIFLVGVALAIPAGLVWQHAWRRWEELKDLRAKCSHEWGPTQSMFPDNQYAYRHCRICGKQQNQEKDGTWRGH